MRWVQLALKAGAACGKEETQLVSSPDTLRACSSTVAPTACDSGWAPIRLSTRLWLEVAITRRLFREETERER